jgi:F-type H+-transporting ATPase subunit b
MKRIALAAAVLCGLWTVAPAQEHGKEPAKEQAKESAQAHAKEGESHAAEGHGEAGGLEIWKWANFGVLALGIGYLIGKNAGPMFAARSKQIRKDMTEAEEARKDAEARAAEVDRRLANLEAEIGALRAESQREAQAETERLTAHSAAEMAKIQAHAEQEIVAAGKAARLELKRYSAHLAVDLAERRIRDRMTPDTQDALVRGFVRDLK